MISSSNSITVLRILTLLSAASTALSTDGSATNRNNNKKRVLEISNIFSEENIRKLRNEIPNITKRKELSTPPKIRREVRKSHRSLHFVGDSSSSSSTTSSTTTSSFLKVQHNENEPSSTTAASSSIATHKVSSITNSEKSSSMTLMSGPKQIATEEHKGTTTTTSASVHDGVLAIQDTAHGGKPRLSSIYGPDRTPSTGSYSPNNDNTRSSSTPVSFFQFPGPIDPNEGPSCGDGFLDDGEECDYGIDNGYGFCTWDCFFHNIPFCGNGIIEDYEECDDGILNGHGDCTLDCYTCDHEYSADSNPDAQFADEYRNGDRTCDETDMLILVWLETDFWSPTEGAMFMFDSNSPVDESIWSYDVGSFRPDTVYQWATCLPADACYEFYYFDAWADGFLSGGIYFEAGHETLLDVYPTNIGTYYMYEEFWGVQIGSGCENPGSIDVPSERVRSYEYDWADPAPHEMTNTSLCGLETSVDVQLEYEGDFWSAFENELFLFDADTPPYVFYWEYEVGSFREANYTWTICVPADECNEFYFFDEYGDGIESGGLTLTVDGAEALSIKPGDNGTYFDGEQYWGVAFGDCSN